MVTVVRSTGFVDPCIPTRAYRVPSGPGWVHEIKHDGYRLQVRREGEAVRLFTRRGYDWSGRYPAIAATAMLLRARSFTLDGEAVVCGPDGVAIFDALHRRGTVSEAMLYAFDLLELDGEDLRSLPLGDRKASGEVAGRAPARHRPQRPHRRGRRLALRARVSLGTRGHCVETAERTLSVGPLNRVAAAKSWCRGCPAAASRNSPITIAPARSIRTSAIDVLTVATKTIAVTVAAIGGNTLSTAMFSAVNTALDVAVTRLAKVPGRRSAK
jgi:hypothetical protein